MAPPSSFCQIECSLLSPSSFCVPDLKCLCYLVDNWQLRTELGSAENTDGSVVDNGITSHHVCWSTYNKALLTVAAAQSSCHCNKPGPSWCSRQAHSWGLFSFTHISCLLSGCVSHLSVCHVALASYRCLYNNMALMRFKYVSSC